MAMEKILFQHDHTSFHALVAEAKLNQLVYDVLPQVTTFPKMFSSIFSNVPRDYAEQEN
jgi:hypothetical protein